jgi:hypothetical protein
MTEELERLGLEDSASCIGHTENYKKEAFSK